MYCTLFFIHKWIGNIVKSMIATSTQNEKKSTGDNEIPCTCIIVFECSVMFNLLKLVTCIFSKRPFNYFLKFYKNTIIPKIFTLMI